MEPESSLPYSQAPATYPYPEPTPSSPHNPLPLPQDPSYYYPPIYVLVSPMVSFPQVSPPKPCAHLSLPPYVPHAPPISFFSILYFIYLNFFFIISSHLRLGLPSGLFPNHIRIITLLLAKCVTCEVHLIIVYHLSNNFWGIHHTKLLNMQFSPFSSQFPPLKPKYPYHSSIFDRPRRMYFS